MGLSAAFTLGQSGFYRVVINGTAKQRCNSTRNLLLLDNSTHTSAKGCSTQDQVVSSCVEGYCSIVNVWLKLLQNLVFIHNPFVLGLSRRTQIISIRYWAAFLSIFYQVEFQTFLSFFIFSFAKSL